MFLFYNLAAPLKLNRTTTVFISLIFIFMKKFIYLIGIVAIMAACSSNTAKQEATQEEATEVQMEATEEVQEAVTEEAVVDSAAVTATEEVAQ